MTQSSTSVTRRRRLQPQDGEPIAMEDRMVTDAILAKALRDLQERVSALEKRSAGVHGEERADADAADHRSDAQSPQAN